VPGRCGRFADCRRDPLPPLADRYGKDVGSLSEVIVNQTSNSSLRKGKKNRRRHRGWVICMYLAPAVFVYCIYIFYPIIETFHLSLYEWDGGFTRRFLGFDNFDKLFSDRIFWKALLNNLKIVFTSVFLQIPLGLIMALLLLSKLRGRRFLQTIYFMPHLMSTVAIGLLWMFIYDPVNGAMNRLLNVFGIPNIAWLSDEKFAMPAVLLVIIWQHAPFYMILFKAAIVGISEDLFEAAAIDGANAFEKFRYITFPLLIPTIVTSSTLAIVGSLKSFDTFYIMTLGGPNNSTELIGTYMYKQAFIHFNMGYGSAVAFMMFLFAFIAAGLLQVIEARRKVKGAA